MSENDPLDFDIDRIALTDRDLFSLYLKYPDMLQSDEDFHDGVYEESPLGPLTTSSPESSPQSSQLNNSPLPNLTRYETPVSSPLGPSDITPFPALAIVANEQEVDELTIRFDQTLKSDDISDDTGKFLTEMKSIIMMMGSILFSATGEVSTELETVWRVKSAANWLILSLNRARAAVEREVHAFETILQLAPFTVRPALEDLWTNYKQMAELIIQHTTIPSAKELDLCNLLCHIYDVCIYQPFLATSGSRDDDEGLQEYLDNLYNSIMMLLRRHKQWITAMKHVGDDFTRPTMRRILHLPGVLRQILEFEEHREEATKSVLQMEFARRRILTALDAKNRRKQQQFSKRGGFVLHRGHASVS